MNFLSCRGVSAMIARGELEEASAPLKILARLHLFFCRHCRRFRRQIELAGRAARLWAGSLLDPGRQEALEKRLNVYLKEVP